MNWILQRTSSARALMAVVALTLAVYLPALGASFQFDDWSVVLGDARVGSVAAWWNSMPGMRALTKLSFALNNQWDGRVEWFRAVNTLLHLCNAALVFSLARTLALRLHGGDEAAALVIAVVTSLMFALHPVQTESVTYISARSNGIAAFFCLLALLVWIRRSESGWDWRSAGLVALLYLAALAGKETAAVLPLAMLLCLLAGGRPQRLSLLLPLILCVVFVAWIALLWTRLPYGYLFQTSLDVRGPLANLVAQVQGIGWLVGQLVRWGRLNADPMLVPVVTLSAGVVIQGLLLAGALVTGFLFMRTRPALAFGILWFFLWLAPTNSLLARLDLANERQLYMAIIGPAWILGHAIAATRQRAGIVIILLLAILLVAGTVLRNRVYATESSFWQDVVAKSPHNARAWNNLGMAEATACRVAEAKRAFGIAAALDPESFRPSINLALLEQGDLPGMPETCP